MSWYCEASVAFLEAAGLDFPRHATEGIEPVRSLSGPRNELN